ncbi:unnamed protein product [Cuscuta campestris]|uniref:Ubiquitin-like protease family profile domain-containing protein n=1 Tax=Cuscuta campestris TaxID=132261 RepID=A0A484N6B1_9ASTE|nr:unnamed protein product [Cuscuta campestris]
MLRKLDWTQMEKVFMTIHARNRHWVLAVLDFPNATIWVYDSLKGAQSKSYVRPILERLPLLFELSKLPSNRDVLKHGQWSSPRMCPSSLMEMRVAL